MTASDLQLQSQSHTWASICTNALGSWCRGAAGRQAKGVREGGREGAGYFSGFRIWECQPTLGVPSLPFPPISLFSLTLPLPSYSPFLRSRALSSSPLFSFPHLLFLSPFPFPLLLWSRATKIQLGDLGSAVVSSPSGVWGGARAKIKFDAFLP